MFQAIVVIAGAHASTPHPTLLPSGLGSLAPKYKVPKGNYTFYYTEIALESKLKRKVDQLKSMLLGSGGRLSYDWRGVRPITSKEDFYDWEKMMDPFLGRKKAQRFDSRRSQEALDTFRAVSAVETDIPMEETRVVTNEVAERT